MNAKQPPEPSKSPASTVLPWVAGTAAGGAAGAIACQLLLGSSPTGAGFVLLLPLLMGAAIGAGQWLALREHAPLPLAWIAATALGWLPAPLFYLQPGASNTHWDQPAYRDGYAHDPESWRREPWLPGLRYPEVAVPSVGAFAGIGAGIAQLLAQRGRRRPRAAWVAASALGHFAGGVLALLIGPWFLRAFLDMRMSLSGSPVRDVLEATLLLATPLWYGALLGAVAGLGLAAVGAPAPETPARHTEAEKGPGPREGVRPPDAAAPTNPAPAADTSVPPTPAQPVMP